MSAQTENSSAGQPAVTGAGDGYSGTPNLGNPVFTPHKTVIQSATAMVDCHRTQEPIAKQQHPMYATTSTTYGRFQPSVETTPTSFHGKSQKFSEHLCQSGMYRNHSLNSAMDHTRV